MSKLRGAWALGLGMMVVALTACQPTESGCTTEGCPADATCNAISGQCEPLKQCTGSTDCAPGEACLGGTCSSCTTNVRCTTDLTTCDPVKSDCATCVDDTSCGGAFPRCGNSGCTACRTAADCGGGTPHCAYRWCVQCQSNGDCPTGTSCKAGTCAAPCSYDSDCAAPVPFCNGGACMQCRTEQDCPSGEACYEGTCRAVLAGDTCRSAIDLPLPGGSAVVKGSISSSWSADSQRPDVRWEVDAFYRVTVTEEVALNAELSLTGLMPEGKVTVYRGECGALFPLGSGFASVKDLVVVPGTYYVAVTVQPQSTDTYTLRVHTSPGSRAVGNHCDKPQLLAMGAPGGSTVTVQGTTAGLHPVLPDYCDEAFEPLPDAVYAFELQERSHVAMSLTPTEPSSEFTLTVVQDCYTRQTSCSASSRPGQTKSWADGPLEPGRYFIHVRTLAAPGPFELTVKATPWATNGTCETALPLAFVDGVLTTTGDVRYTDAGYLGCSTSTRHRLTYTFSTRGLGDRSMVLELAGEQGMQPPSAFITTACRTQEDPGLACMEYSSAQQPRGRMEVPFLPEGDYSLQLSDGGSSGLFSLRAVLGPPYPPPANDTCSGAESLSLTSGTFQVSADTRGAIDHQSASCNGEYSQLRGRDVVYRVPISGKGRLEAVLQPTTPDYDATLHMDLGCTVSSFTCADAQGPGGEERLARRLNDAYDYDAFLWVDGQNGTEGAFTLSGRWVPAPAHDTCAGAQALTVGQEVAGTLEAAFYDSGGPCYSRPSYVPDLFYTFTASSNGTATVKLTPSGFDGVLSAQTPCSTASWDAICHGEINTGGVDAIETATFAVQRNTQYVVVVSGATAESDGSFTLAVSIQ